MKARSRRPEGILKGNMVWTRCRVTGRRHEGTRCSSRSGHPTSFIGRCIATYYSVDAATGLRCGAPRCSHFRSVDSTVRTLLFGHHNSFLTTSPNHRRTSHTISSRMRRHLYPELRVLLTMGPDPLSRAYIVPGPSPGCRLSHCNPTRTSGFFYCRARRACPTESGNRSLESCTMKNPSS